MTYYTISLLAHGRANNGSELDELSWNDLTIVLCCFLCILFYIPVCLGLTTTLSASLFMIFLSTVCSIISGTRLYAHVYNILVILETQSKGATDAIELSTRTRALKSGVLCACVSMIALVVYPFIYALSSFGFIGYDATTILFSTTNYMYKNVFSIVLLDSYLVVLDPNIVQLTSEQLANSSRRLFLRYVFHEVRVPLNSIAMGIQVLKGKNSLGEEEMGLLNMITESAGFMSQTLNDVLSIQKMEDGKLELDLRPFWLPSMLKRVISSQDGSLRSKNIEVQSAICDSIPNRLIGDRYRVEHVLANLLSNAIKFSPENSIIYINVTAGVVSDQVQNVVFHVIDKGMGISKEDIETLFQAYAQIRPGDFQKGRGTGVGLSICKEIVHLHGGEIKVKSRLQSEYPADHGSEFYFNIPFSVANDQTYISDEVEKVVDQLPLVSESHAGFTTKPIEDWVVAVVDDVMSNRKLLSQLLMKEGITSIMFEDGSKVCAFVEENPSKIDMIFMDNLMPVKTGLETTQFLRDHNFQGFIAGLTGNAMEDDVNDFMKSGADIVLVKPLKFSQLKKLIEHCNRYGLNSTRNCEVSAISASVRGILTLD